MRHKGRNGEGEKNKTDRRAMENRYGNTEETPNENSLNIFQHSFRRLSTLIHVTFY